MGERKVLNKYYEPNYNPDVIRRLKKPKDKQDNVRMMLPMTMRCNTCSNFLYTGKKFNMRKETCLDEGYLTIKVHRFYFRCTDCCAEITFKTDPRNHDYIVEHGAKRNYEALKDAQQAELVLQEVRETEEENAMKWLENKSYNSKREMEILDALEDIKLFNKRKAQITHEQLLDIIIKNNEDQGEEVESIKQKFEKAKERQLEETEENKNEGIHCLFNKLSVLQGVTEVKKAGLGPRMAIKVKKIKTEEDSLGNGKANLISQSKKAGCEVAKTVVKNIILNLCSYSDDGDYY